MLLITFFTACDKDAHENEYLLPEGKGALIIGFEQNTEDITIEDLTIYLFGEDGQTEFCQTYTDPRELASEHIALDAGNYTLLAVANSEGKNSNETKTEALPQETTLPDLAEWLSEHAADFPNLMTASTQTEVKTGVANRLLLQLQKGTEGIHLSTLALRLTLPEPDMPAYTSTRAKDGENTPLRCVAEVYQTGTDNLIHHREWNSSMQPDGTYLAELSLMPGDYDLRLWADWGGGYYHTDDLSAVTVLTDNYVAGEETDKKDAYYTASVLNIGEDNTEQAITLTRPFARYRLIANDVEGYLNLIANGEDYPPVEDLQVHITYEGFFPTGFDVATGKPNDALNTGIHYTTAPVAATSYPEAEARQIGSDFVLTNGEESFVTVTIQMIDPRTGEAISTVSGIQIPYRRGHLTTVTGRFLTAGKTTGGVEVDNNWENDVTIEF